MFRLSIIVSALVALVLAGCASRGEIETIQRQLDYLERSSTQTQEHIAELDSMFRITLEKNVAYQADLKVALADLLDQNQIIDGRLTDMESRIAAIINKLDNPQALRTVVRSGESIDSTADSISKASDLPQVDPEKLFENAFSDMRVGNYDLAIMQFGEFIDLFKDHERADDAQYWLGECYYGKKDFEKAIPEFEKVEKHHPKSDRLVQALYKLARSHMELGKTERAKTLFKRIITDYPKTFEAKPAQEKLKELE